MTVQGPVKKQQRDGMSHRGGDQGHIRAEKWKEEPPVPTPPLLLFQSRRQVCKAITTNPPTPPWPCTNPPPPPRPHPPLKGWGALAEPCSDGSHTSAWVHVESSPSRGRWRRCWVPRGIKSVPSSSSPLRVQRCCVVANTAERRAPRVQRGACVVQCRCPLPRTPHPCPSVHPPHAACIHSAQGVECVELDFLSGVPTQEVDLLVHKLVDEMANSGTDAAAGAMIANVEVSCPLSLATVKPQARSIA